MINVIWLRGVALNPRGDVILCDVAHEDASVVLADLRELDIPPPGLHRATLLTFAVVAALITSVAIALDSEVLLLGGMVVGPEFGPIAGFCVAAVQRRSGLAKQSAVALTAGLLAAGAASALAGLALRATDTIESVSACPSADRAAGVRPARRTSARSADAGVLA